MDGLSGVLMATGCGLIMLVVAVPLWLDRIPPNRWYGYRTRSTTTNEELWYAVNHVSGIILTTTGALVLFTGIIGIGARHDDRQQAELVVLTLILLSSGLIAAIVRGYLVIRESSSITRE